MDRPTLACCAIATAALLAAAANGQTVVNLGYLPGGTDATAQALSADGSTVVGFGYTATSVLAFRWRAATGMVSLGTLPNSSSAPNSQATAVNADGSVVVGYSDALPSGSRGFRWTAAGGMQSVGALPPLNNGSNAYGVNADGSVVVGDSSYPQVGYHAFRWTAATGITDLTPPTPIMVTSAQAVNGDGTVAVGLMSTPDGFRAARFASGAALSLGNIDTTHTSTAIAVSSDGSIVAGYADNFNGQSRATRWTAGTGTVSLGVLPGGNFAQARAISPDGQVIVGQSDSATTSNRGFLWTQATGMVNVHDYLTSKGVDLTGWTLSGIRGVTNGATTIAGNGIFNGQSAAWIITGLPPTGGCPADFGSAGGLPPGDGVLDNNDFIVFINLFFAHDPRADIGRAGGFPGGDGAFNNNDFIVFINQFFSPCP